MPLTEEVVVSYDAYRDKVAELEKANRKDRIVFIFEGGNHADGKNWDTGTDEVVKHYPELRKKVDGTLIHVRVPKSEWDAADCKWKHDSKFKVTIIPFGAVFNTKQTLGRNWIHKKLEGADRLKNFEKMKDLFR